MNDKLTEKATIYDIAKKANVSITTVSRVFNGSPLVSKKTKRKVEKVIEEMNYIPNAIARSLVCRTSNTIGLIVSDITNPFFTNVIEGIENILNNNSVTAFLCNTGYSPEKEKMYISQMLEKRVDGLIIFSAYASDTALIERTKNIIPVVSVQSTYKETDSVNTDDEAGAYSAVDYLIKLGHGKIAFLVYDYVNSTISNRMKGYLKAHRDNGIAVNKEYIITSSFKPNCGFYMANQLLEKSTDVTAIFAYNDQIAVSACLALQMKGLKIPEDISVVGYDDIELASLVTPKLTTVAQPLYEIGKNAAELLLKRIKENRKSTPQLIQLPTKLVVRESTRKL